MDALMLDRIRGRLAGAFSARLRDERGVTLVVALAFMTIFSISTAAIVNELVLNQSGTHREMKVLTALGAAEGEMNLAMSWVQANDTNASPKSPGTVYPSSCTDADKLDGTHCYYTDDAVAGADPGTAGWWAEKLDAATCKQSYGVTDANGNASVCWLVDGRAAVDTTTREVQSALSTWNNQSTNTVSYQTTVYPTTTYGTTTNTGSTTVVGTTINTQTTQTQNLAAWSGAYASGSAASCLNFRGANTSIAESIITPYNLCFSGNGSGVEEQTGFPLSVEVGSGLYMNVGHIGCSSTTGCSSGNKNQLTVVWAKTCYTGAFGSTSAINCQTTPSGSWPLYYKSTTQCTTAGLTYGSNCGYLSASPAFPAKPTVNGDSMYATASPGPKDVCTAGGSIPVSFDNNGIRNNSLGNVDPFGGTSYTCTGKTGSLVWNASQKRLTINGTVFFDGSLSTSTSFTYQGRGTIYFDGTITLTKNICAGFANTTCAVTGANKWDPNSNLMVLAALNNDNTSVSSTSVSFSGNSSWQVAVWANGLISETGGSALMGPVIGDQLDIGGNSSYFVPLGSLGLPSGAPLTWNNSVSTTPTTITSTVPVTVTDTVPYVTTIQSVSTSAYTIGSWGIWGTSWRQIH